MKHQHEGFGYALALIRRSAGQGLVEDGTEGVDIRQRPDGAVLPLGLLGSHVTGRANDLAGEGLPLFLQTLGQPEVGNLGGAVGAKQDIGRLQVAMHDPRLVR